MKDDAERAHNAAIALQLSNAVIYNSDGAFRALAFKNRHLIVAALNAFAQQPEGWAVAVQLSKHEGGKLLASLVLVVREGGSEAEALKHAIDYAATEKPGFSIDQYLIQKIPPAAMLDVAPIPGEE